jgi:hypothetical protein
MRGEDERGVEKGCERGAEKFRAKKFCEGALGGEYLKDGGRPAGAKLEEGPKFDEPRKLSFGAR